MIRTDHDRNGCALHGALRLLDSIESLVPILHASAGCGLGAWASEDSLALTLGGSGLRHRELSATLLQEKQVVFGGTSRLREQIKNTLKVVNGDVYAVVTGCVPEVIGDDVLAMVKEAQEQTFPVISLSAPGFSGNAWWGHAQAAKALVSQLVVQESAQLNADLTANLFGLVPGQDATWDGDLLELESLLALIGLKTNRLLGFGQTPGTWRNASRSHTSVVLSPWGRPAAEELRDHFGVPFIDFGWIPVGSKDAGLILGKVASALGLHADIAEKAKYRLDNELRYYLKKASSALLSGNVQKRISIAAGSAFAVGLSRFLSGTLGQLVEQVIITDEVEENSRVAILAALRDSGARLAEVTFTASRFDINALLRKARSEVILGSALETDVADELSVPILEISTPMLTTPCFRRSYAGVRGATALTEDFLAVLAQWEQHHRQDRRSNHLVQVKDTNHD